MRPPTTRPAGFGSSRMMASDGDRLAAARFADDRHDLAAADLEGDALDRAHDAARGHEMDVQILDLEQRRRGPGSGRMIGLRIHPGTQKT